MANKVVLVTGSSQGGIGAALCEEFAERGYTVYASARRLESLEGFKHKGICRLELDVTSDESCASAVEHIIETEGRIDVLVSNAGMLCIGALADIPIEQAQKTFDTNVFGTLRLARGVIPHMAKRRSGLIITIGSVAGEVTTPWNGIYCASKAALHAIAETISMECAPLGIQAMNVITASVQSNLATNHVQLFRMPENSLWKAYADRIVDRLHLSQGRRSMPSKEFARLVVDKATKTTVPVHMRVGGGIAFFSLLNWLPRWLTLTIIWRYLGRLRTPDV
ncbi:oxidoreductase [Exidia glandulosa HHB12029]|uniref:Oxidoreductase n=1 Tax=Exidia glandulosa HHB12029 TaxID=1314781 RepID=A0A165J071_EXIGL|nr:oxidoreductase [Exidia glandulosa HHB12029]